MKPRRQRLEAKAEPAFYADPRLQKLYTYLIDERRMSILSAKEVVDRVRWIFINEPQ